MPGLDFSQLSSNWKKLQQQLKSDQPKEPANNGLKRKRLDEKSGPKKRFRAVLDVNSKPVELPRRRKMGGYSSKEYGAAQADHNRSKLVKDHGIAADDVSAAYGAAHGPLRTYHDEINGGLHASHKAGKFVALDCEMVGTGPPPHADNLLARVSLVNFHGEQIYDSYVLPPAGEKVEDYRTFVSGIKPSQLRPGYARLFAEVQKDIASLLQGRVLVGHALRNDLQVLLLSHPKRDLRDTSRHPKYRIESKGKPPALRNLARQELGMSIQAGEHSSVEDARAAMLLFRKDKAGFEEENRKHFGQSGRFEKTSSKPAKAQSPDPADDDDEAEDDVEDDVDLLDGEVEDVNGEGASHRYTTSTPKKKRKKKKRTKRK